MIRYQTHVRKSRKSHCQFHFIYKILLFIVYFFGPARTSLEKVVDFREVQLWGFLKKRKFISDSFISDSFISDSFISDSFELEKEWEVSN